MSPFRLDLRSLALLRIALGCLLLADLAIRAPDIEPFFLSSGIFPVDALPASHWTMKHFELYRQVDSLPAVAMLFALATAAASALCLGWRTRLATAISWYMLCSLQNRTMYLSDGGDVLLRAALFCGMFLPWGACWSLDARRHPEWQRLPRSFSSLATVALVTQVCVMYLTAACLKSDASWRVTGDALYLALSIDQFSTGFGQWLLNFPNLLRGLNFAALATEFLGPLLLLCPLFGWVRAAGLLLLALFHLGIACCLHLGLFVPIDLAVLLGLLPSVLFPPRNFEDAPACAFSHEGDLPPAYKLSRLERGLLVVVVAFLLLQNATVVPGTGLSGLVHGQALQRMIQFGRGTDLMQNWTLFAPHPFLADGWFVVDAQHADGSHSDLLTGATPPSLSKPARVSAQFANQRWRRCFQSLGDRYNPRHVPLYLRWAGSRWNRQHPGASPVTELRLVLVQELTTLPGQPATATPVELGAYPSSWLPGSVPR